MFSKEEKEFKKFYKIIKKEPEFKQLLRNYKIPNPYADYNNIVFHIYLTYRLLSRALEKQIGNEAFEKITELNAFKAGASMEMLLELNEPSVYCVDTELLKAIELTDLPPILPNFYQSVPFGVLLFPKHYVEEGESGGINYLIFSHFSQQDPLPLRPHNFFTKESKNKSCLQWFSFAPKIETFYSQELLIDKEGSLFTQEAEGFNYKISSILIQSLYFIQEGDYLENTKNKGFGKNLKNRGETKQPKSQVVRHPKYLGRGFALDITQPLDQAEQEKEKQSIEKNYPSARHSPTPHIRRGHRKIVWHGKNRTQQKTVWIKPTLVGKN